MSKDYESLTATSEAFVYATIKVSIKGISPHDFRKTFVRVLLDVIGDLSTVKRSPYTPARLRALLLLAYRVLGAENSEVLPSGSVAVAVTFCPLRIFLILTLKEALPLPSVVTLFWPRRVLPSSVPWGLEKS